MPSPRIDFGCIYFGGQVFIVGGWQEFYVTSAQRYDIKEDKWLDLPSLNEEREDLSLCIVEDRYLFAFGNVTTRGRRFKASKGGCVDYSFERINLAEEFSEQKWELLTVKTDFN